MTNRFTKTILMAATVVMFGAATMPYSANAASSDPAAQTAVVKKDVKKTGKHHHHHKCGKQCKPGAKGKMGKTGQARTAPKTTQTMATPNN